MRLDCLKEGQQGRIMRLKLSAGLRRRLQDVGLTEGTVICCIRRGPGETLAIYRARGAMLALRRTDSSRIFVEDGA